MRILYSVLFYLSVPFLVMRLLWRSRKNSGYRYKLSQRFGFVQAIKPPCIWLHAVSMGETLAALPLIHALLQQYPKHQLVVTTTTPTGADQINRQQLSRVIHTYTPYDLPIIIKWFLKRTNPQLIVVMETELWPNLLHYAAVKKIPMLLANARLSERSTKRYQKISRWFGPLLNQFNLVATQSEVDSQRFTKIGIDPNKIVQTGNIKFDLNLPENLRIQGNALHQQLGNRFTWIAASTHEGEEKIILMAHRLVLEKIPTALLILVPRHPERFDRVAQLCERNGFSLVRRSLKQMPTSATQIYLGDTIGELRLLYAASDVTFVAGSLLPIGGHNLIEPAALQKSIICGPHLQNCIAIKKLLQAADGLAVINSAGALAKQVITFFQEPQLRDSAAKNAYEVSLKNKGAVAKTMQCVTKVLPITVS